MSFIKSELTNQNPYCMLDEAKFFRKLVIGGVSKTRREDFVLSINDYQTKVNDVLVKIRKEAMNDKTVNYANKTFNWYLTNKSEIIKYILNEGVLEFYGDAYTEKEIVEKLHEADITIIEDNWGTFTWLNHELDEHIIQVEFGNDLQLSYVSING